MTRGRHGWGETGDALGPVSGWVIDGVYIAGDTVWCEEVREAIEQHHPTTIVVNASGARFNEGGPIVMDAGDVTLVRQHANVVVVHLESINHCIERREVYRLLDVFVPNDGETLEV
jgi:hypothetical protein